MGLPCQIAPHLSDRISGDLLFRVTICRYWPRALCRSAEQFRAGACLVNPKSSLGNFRERGWRTPFRPLAARVHNLASRPAHTLWKPFGWRSVETVLASSRARKVFVRCLVMRIRMAGWRLSRFESARVH